MQTLMRDVQTIRPLFELLYFISGILLAIFALIGLWQLKISKETAGITRAAASLAAKRDAYKIAVEQCAYYNDHIIMLQFKMHEAIEKNHISFFEKFKVIVVGDEIKLSYSSTASTNEISAIYPEIFDLTNALESFALFMVSGVAAEDIGFLGVGEHFCSAVREVMPVIKLAEQITWPAPHLTDLFLMWNARLETQKLLVKKAKLEAEETQLAKQNKKVIKPLGVD